MGAAEEDSKGRCRGWRQRPWPVYTRQVVSFTLIYPDALVHPSVAQWSTKAAIVTWNKAALAGFVAVPSANKHSASHKWIFVCETFHYSCKIWFWSTINKSARLPRIKRIWQPINAQRQGQALGKFALLSENMVNNYIQTMHPPRTMGPVSAMHGWTLSSPFDHP